MLCYRLTTAFLAFLGLLSVTQADSPQIVDLGYAVYQGTFNSTSGITDFFGIRYAAPPVGKLRFQKPAPPLNMRSAGMISANVQPPKCPAAGKKYQIETPFRDLSTSARRQSDEIEDCLFLNVHVPGEVNSMARMPVVFWIHGGGYVIESPFGFNGGDLIREAGGGVVAVELQYRLGVFGFLPGKEVKRKGALNAGLLDQQFALEWVQKNIHLFGGDPSQVTIWGESAGAGSVVQHMVAHGGNTQPPLFDRAITSSTYLPSQYNFDDPIPERLYSEFVQRTGCGNSSDTFQCLVDTDAGILESANVEINDSGFSGTSVTVPVVDGLFIVEGPIATLERGTLNGERLMTMTNAFEGAIFINIFSNFSEQMTLTDYATQLFPLFNDHQIQEVVNHYSGIGLNSVNDQAIAVMGESIFICPTYRLLEAFPGRSYKGLFAVPPGQHGEDLAYYFPETDGPPLYENVEFSASFAGSFMGFVKSGDPNAHVLFDITPAWNTFSQGHTEMLFNRTEDFQPDIRPFMTDPGLIERCNFWKSMAPFIPQ